MADVPAGYAPTAPQGRFINFRVAEGDFVHGVIKSREERVSEKYGNTETLFTVEVIDAKLTDYNKKTDNALVTQSDLKVGEIIIIPAAAQLARELNRLADGRTFFARFEGKKEVKTKIGISNMNTYTVAAAPEAETAAAPAASNDVPF